MQDLIEARKNLDLSLGETLSKQYILLLRQWFSLKNPITKLKFDLSVRKLGLSQEQLRCHNKYVLALLANCLKVKTNRVTAERYCFELADYRPSSPSMVPPDFENRNASIELFLPDNSFICARIAIHCWQNQLEGADDSVSDYIAHACQMFVKNIIAAMISRIDGYKIRNKKFPHAFGVPVPNSFLRNASKIIDYTQDLSVELAEEEDMFVPTYRPCLEAVQQQIAFSYACAQITYVPQKLTVKLLHSVIREDKSLIKLHSISSVKSLKVCLNKDAS